MKVVELPVVSNKACYEFHGGILHIGDDKMCAGGRKDEGVCEVKPQPALSAPETLCPSFLVKSLACCLLISRTPHCPIWMSFFSRGTMEDPWCVKKDRVKLSLGLVSTGGAVRGPNGRRSSSACHSMPSGSIRCWSTTQAWRRTSRGSTFLKPLGRWHPENDHDDICDIWELLWFSFHVHLPMWPVPLRRTWTYSKWHKCCGDKPTIYAQLVRLHSANSNVPTHLWSSSLSSLWSLSNTRLVCYVKQGKDGCHHLSGSAEHFTLCVAVMKALEMNLATHPSVIAL